jgi:GNAT superfamily N-acetyltransferase
MPPALFHVRQAGIEDIEEVSGILREAARWLEERGDPLWRDEELRPDRIESEVADGLYFLGADATGLAATVKFQLDDPLFWPESPRGEATFIHRLAVRRRAAGGTVSAAILQWAVDRTRSLGSAYLRLDCDAARGRLRAVYERFGFRHHSDRQVGPYFVARYQYRVPNRDIRDGR